MVEGINQEEIENHLEQGKLLLSKGQYNDALNHYHAAIEADKSNYLTYFKRATVYLAIGKHKSALEDLNEVIYLKPDAAAARLQRGSVLLKQGRLDEAHFDLEWVLRKDPENAEAHHLYALIEPLQHQVQKAYIAMSDGQYATAIDFLNELLTDIPWDVKLREMRSQAYEKLGDLVSAIGDLRASTKMRSDNTDGYLKLSKLYYEIGEPEESLTAIRECLKLDPDHKGCFDHYRKVKKVANQIKSMLEFSKESKFTECADKAEAALKTESSVTRMVHLIQSKKCFCLSKKGDPVPAIKACSDALKLDEQDINVLCDRAEAHLFNEDYDEGKLHSGRF